VTGRSRIPFSEASIYVLCEERITYQVQHIDENEGNDREFLRDRSPWIIVGAPPPGRRTPPGRS